MSIWSDQSNPPIYMFGTEANKFIKSSVHYLPKKARIAAYAEGEGANAVFLAKIGHKVTAYDSSTSGLSKVRLLARLNGVTIKTKLVELLQDKLPKENYDGAIMVFGHFPHMSQPIVLDKIMDSIKRKGVFMFEVYEYAQLLYDTGGPKDLRYLYNAEDILRWARRYNLKHFFTGEVLQQETSNYTETCRVIQVIVEK